MDVICRQAQPEDISALHELILYYASKGIMLPRSKETLAANIDSFVVAEAEERIIGCGSLCRLGDNLMEIRSLGLSDGCKGKGIGGKLLAMLERMAAEQGVTNVMALTYEVSFFEKYGYHMTAKHVFPEKVWRDCVHCKNQFCCDEIAVLKRLV